MKKIAINTCYGGFGLSHEAVMKYAEKKGITLYPYITKRDENGRQIYDRFVPYEEKEKEPRNLIFYFTNPIVNEKYPKNPKINFYEREIDRDDPLLIATIEELGEKANGDGAKLRIVEIPDDVKWEIDDYDGMESVNEVHRKWS